MCFKVLELKMEMVPYFSQLCIEDHHNAIMLIFNNKKGCPPPFRGCRTSEMPYLMGWALFPQQCVVCQLSAESEIFSWRNKSNVVWCLIWYGGITIIRCRESPDYQGNNYQMQPAVQGIFEAVSPIATGSPVSHE